MNRVRKEGLISVLFLRIVDSNRGNRGERVVTRKTTEELLAESLLELAAKKAVDKITVREIASNTGVTTATFYNYFQDKFELIFWIYDYQVADILLDFEAGEVTWEETLQAFVRLLQEDATFYRNALQNTHGQDSLLVNASRQMVKSLTAYLEKEFPQEVDEELRFELRFYLSGCAHATFGWLFTHSVQSVEQLVAYFLNVMPLRLKSYLQ